MTDFQGQMVLLVVSICVGAFIYFIPALNARGKNRAPAIFVLNLFLGWTIIGWVGALIWSMCEKPVKA